MFRNNKSLPKYLTDRKLKLSAVFIFAIKDAKKDKIFNFLKSRFVHNGCPYGFDFWHVFRDIYDDSKKYNFAIYFQKLYYSKCQKLLKTQWLLTKRWATLGPPNYMHLIQLYKCSLE